MAKKKVTSMDVAKLAGIPQTVIDRANVILSHIQALAADNPILLDDIPKTAAGISAAQAAPAPVSPGLFSDEEIIISEILSTDTDNLTPLNALQAIARWKKALSGL